MPSIVSRQLSPELPMNEAVNETVGSERRERRRTIRWLRRKEIKKERKEEQSSECKREEKRKVRKAKAICLPACCLLVRQLEGNNKKRDKRVEATRSLNDQKREDNDSTRV
jgi:hypothetical protein